MNRKALTYFEIDLDYCALSYGVSPCAAAIGVTGEARCFNTLKTCQDRGNFTNSPVTLRFAIDADYLPPEIDAIPSIESVSFTPATISLGEDLGTRASLNVSFRDHLHSDAGPGLDKYHASRGYDPFKRGTFWGRFRARQPFLRGRNCRLILGFVGQSLGEMETRHYVMDSFNGPTPDGTFMITAKDVLKLADDERSQAPSLSNGSLLSDIASSASALTVTPLGVGAEYRTSGFIAVGGKEIMSYTRPAGGNDASTVLLCHFDGANNATSTTDSSTSARTITANGNVKLSTTDKVFGTASAYFDGAGDFWSLADNAAWTFAGNFTLDCRANITTLASARTLLCHSTDINNMWRLYVTVAGALCFEIKSAGAVVFSIETAAGLVEAGTWVHVAVSRESSTFRLFVGGILRKSGFTTAAIPNYTGTLKIGIGGDGVADAMLGYVDEVRISSVARWVANFFPYAAAYDNGNVDNFTITRAQYNTTAIAHKAEDIVQQCLIFTGQDPADIKHELLVRYAGINPSFISLPNWKAETAAYLGRVYTAIVAQPVGVKKLLCELIQQTASAEWWDDIGQQIRLQVLRTIPTGSQLFDEDTLLEGTLNVAEQPEARVSIGFVFYGQRNPLEPLENETNYRSVLQNVDAQTTSDYGSAVIKKIYSRWIPQFGGTIADRITDILLGRYKNPPRAFSFEVFRREDGIRPLLGGGYMLEDHSIQDASGARARVPVQITRINPRNEKYVCEAQEAIFESDVVVDLNNRTIIIDADTYNINLRTLHDTLFPVITDPTGITLTCIIQAGISVGSTSISSPSFEVGSWVSGLSVVVINRGRLQGHGGPGGNVSGAGQNGGTAFRTRYPVSLDNTLGEIWSGAGGGAPGSVNGGGGGCGDLPGVGGSGTVPGNNGTTEVGGAGVPGGAINPGNGGGPGLDGAFNSFGTGTRGLRGAAIDGISYVTNLGTGDRRGTTIN